jgi:hypothetical protein
MLVQLLWGCDPSRQFEAAWLRHLIGADLSTAWPWWRPSDALPAAQAGAVPVLVESGLLRLERAPAPERVAQLGRERQARLQALRQRGPFAVMHLSDEEGLDADSWYGALPPDTPIWRNFAHERLAADPRVQAFPIGPRDLFLAPLAEPLLPASQRAAPWAFMGTLWPSGSRRWAVSLFLSHLPAGHFYGGQHFGQGLPLERYRANLLSSVFALAPEGDRHLDTFRLWESLCCGCIPLLVDHRNTAQWLLPAEHPLPLQASWPEALAFAKRLLAHPARLDALQAGVQAWWRGYQHHLSLALHDSWLAVQQAPGQGESSESSPSPGPCGCC